MARKEHAVALRLATDTLKAVDSTAWIHPAVRDVAWLISSPGLLSGGGRAAGTVSDDWCQHRYVDLVPLLEQLDQNPEPLLRYIAQHEHGPRRLGRYAEVLAAFWLEHWPGAGQVQRSIAVHDGTRTLGEFDLVWSDHHQRGLHHWELAVKFYLRSRPSTDPQAWIGPNPDDHLHAKLDTMFKRQLRLGRSRAGQAALRSHFPVHLIHGLEARALIKGYLFYPVAEWPEPQLPPRGLAHDHAAGWWLHQSEAKRLPQNKRDSRYIDLPKAAWLAPAAVPRKDPQVLAHGEMIEHIRSHFRHRLRAIMVAELRPGLDGRWHERSRGFVVHDQWPNPVVPPVHG